MLSKYVIRKAPWPGLFQPMRDVDIKKRIVHVCLLAT
jgi:hypothetical protein